MEIEFFTADVFTNEAFSGAQIAVVPDASGLSDEQMQRIAREFNLSDTVFVNGNDQHFSLRTFSPLREVDFGSHTTIAAAHVLASLGKISLTQKHTPLTLEHKSGPISVHISERDGKPELTQFSMTSEPVVDNYVPSNEDLAELLSLPTTALCIKDYKPLLVSNKGVYIVVPVRRFDHICAAQFNRKAWDQSLAPNTAAQNILLFSQQTETSGADFHLRLLSPAANLNDPPVGSAIPAFVAYLCAQAHVKKGTHSFIVERGLKSQRQSLLHVELDNKGSDVLTLRVGGSAVLMSEGKMRVH